MNLNFPVSQNFERTDFTALANNIKESPGNVINTDYQVILNPTITDYIANFFANLFCCFGTSPDNLNYNSDQIIAQITNDLNNSLSQYILDMAENPGVSSVETETGLEFINDAIQLVESDQADLITGKINIQNKGIMALEKPSIKPEITVEKKDLDLAVKEVFKAHQQTVRNRPDLSFNQQIFIDLKEGQYQIESYQRIRKDDKWMLEITFSASIFNNIPNTALCSLDGFPHDILNLPGEDVIEPFTKEEMLQILQDKAAALENQQRQPVIDHKAQFRAKAAELCSKVEPLILAISSRKNVGKSEGAARLVNHWRVVKTFATDENNFEVKAREIHTKYCQGSLDVLMAGLNGTQAILSEWGGKDIRVKYLDKEKTTYRAPLENAKINFSKVSIFDLGGAR